jgi:hypothetical protein
MGIKDKQRWSLYSMSAGMPCGVPRCELNGETVLFIEEAPFELQAALCRWLLIKNADPLPGPPTIKGDRPDADELRVMLAHQNPVDYTTRVDSDNRPAIDWKTWEAFVCWMERTLSDELARYGD